MILPSRTLGGGREKQLCFMVSFQINYCKSLLCQKFLRLHILYNPQPPICFYKSHVFKQVYNEEGTWTAEKTKPLLAQRSSGFSHEFPLILYIFLISQKVTYSFFLTPVDLMHAYVLALTRLRCHCLTFVSYTSYKILVTVPAIASQSLIGRKSE